MSLGRSLAEALYFWNTPFLGEVEQEATVHLDLAPSCGTTHQLLLLRQRQLLGHHILDTLALLVFRYLKSLKCLCILQF